MHSGANRAGLGEMKTTEQIMSVDLDVTTTQMENSMLVAV